MQTKAGNEMIIFDQYPMNTMEKLNENRKTGKYCDLTITIDNKRYACHRLLLTSSVPYFESMFNADVIEVDKNEITLNDIDSNAFDIILDYVYTGVLKFQVDPISNVIIMTATCDYFGLIELSDKCRNLCKKCLNVDNIFEVCSSIERYPDDQLIESSIDFIVRNFRTVCQTNEFVQIPYNILFEVVRSDFLASTDEYTILLAVHQWLIMRHPEERNRYLNELAGAIRYSFIKDDLLVGESRVENEDGFSLAKEVRSFRTIDNDNNFQPTFKRRVGVRLYFFGRPNNNNNNNNNDDDDDAKNVIEVLRYNGDTFEHVPDMRLECVDDEVYRQRVIINCNRFYSLVYCKRSMKNYFQSYDDLVERGWQNLRKPQYVFQVYNMASIDDLNCIYANCSLDSDLNYANPTIFCYVIDRDRWERLKDNCSKNDDQRLCSQSLIAYNNVLYAFGGFNRTFRPSDRTYLFDPRVGTWTVLRSMNKKRGYTAVARFNDRMYVTGGSKGPSYSNEFHVFKMTSIYDVRADKWISASSMINPMYHHQSITYDDRIWCVEGRVPGSIVNVYCPLKKRWADFDGSAIGNFFKTEVAVVPF